MLYSFWGTPLVGAFSIYCRPKIDFQAVVTWLNRYSGRVVKAPPTELPCLLGAGICFAGSNPVCIVISFFGHMTFRGYPYILQMYVAGNILTFSREVSRRLAPT